MPSFATMAGECLLRCAGSPGSMPRCGIFNTTLVRGSISLLPPTAEILRLVEQYSLHAKILDLGCGASTNLPLIPGTFGQYHGVDISESAIKQARALKRPGTSFEVADIFTYQPGEQYDAILLKEVLYYFTADQVVQLLHRLAGSLSAGGKISYRYGREEHRLIQHLPNSRPHPELRSDDFRGKGTQDPGQQPRRFLVGAWTLSLNEVTRVALPIKTIGRSSRTTWVGTKCF